MKSIIVAVDKNMGIGAKNDLLWMRDLPDDLAHFKKMTTGASVIMGRNTFDSIGKPLPNRENIVVSHRPVGVDGVLTAADLPSAYQLARYPIFVIGGGRIYADAITDMDRLYVTEVVEEFPQATVFFPAIDKSVWREVSREHHDADERNKYAFDFVVYDRI
nr:Dihydrofolate reductase [uncultured bacterium]